MTTTASVSAPASMVNVSNSQPSATAARLARADGGPWLFVTAPVTFAVILLLAIYLARISF